MDCYSLKLRRKFWFARKLKNVVAHIIPDDMNPTAPPITITTEINGELVDQLISQRPAAIRYLLVIFKDETREIINLEKYESYEVSKEWFAFESKKAQQESQGKASPKRV